MQKAKHQNPVNPIELKPLSTRNYSTRQRATLLLAALCLLFSATRSLAQIYTGPQELVLNPTFIGSCNTDDDRGDYYYSDNLYGNRYYLPNNYVSANLVGSGSCVPNVFAGQGWAKRESIPVVPHTYNTNGQISVSSQSTAQGSADKSQGFFVKLNGTQTAASSYCVEVSIDNLDGLTTGGVLNIYTANSFGAANRTSTNYNHTPEYEPNAANTTDFLLVGVIPIASIQTTTGGLPSAGAVQSFSFVSTLPFDKIYITYNRKATTPNDASVSTVYVNRVSLHKVCSSNLYDITYKTVRLPSGFSISVPVLTLKYRCTCAGLDVFPPLSSGRMSANGQQTEEQISLTQNEPAHEATLRFEQSAAADITVYNSQGQKISSFRKEDGTQKVNLSTAGFPTGLYLVEIQDGTQRVTKKIIIP